MKLPNSSDVVLFVLTAVVGGYMLFLTGYGAVQRDWKGGGAGLLAALVCASICLSASRRLSRLRRENQEFLNRLEGRPISEALSIARGEASALSPGLVAEKVKIPFESWSAFERGAFQFEIAADEHGRARTFTI